MTVCRGRRKVWEADVRYSHDLFQLNCQIMNTMADRNETGYMP